MYMAIIVPIASAIAPWAREKAVFIIQMIVGILSYTGKFSRYVDSKHCRHVVFCLAWKFGFVL